MADLNRKFSHHSIDNKLIIMYISFHSQVFSTQKNKKALSIFLICFDSGDFIQAKFNRNFPLSFEKYRKDPHSEIETVS